MPNADTTHIASGVTCVAQTRCGLEAAADSRVLERVCDEVAQMLLEDFPEASLELIPALHDVANDLALEPAFRLDSILASERSHEVIEHWIDQSIDGGCFDGGEFDNLSRKLGVRKGICSSVQFCPPLSVAFALSGFVARVPSKVQGGSDRDYQSRQPQSGQFVAERSEKNGPPCEQLSPSKNHGQTTVEARQSQTVSMSEACLNNQIVTIKNGPGCKGRGHFSPIEIFLAGCLEASSPLVRVLTAPLAEVVRLLLAPPSPLQGFLEGKICLPWSVPCEQVGGVGANILSQADSTAHIQPTSVAQSHIPGDTNTPPAPGAIAIGPVDC